MDFIECRGRCRLSDKDMGHVLIGGPFSKAITRMLQARVKLPDQAGAWRNVIPCHARIRWDDHSPALTLSLDHLVTETLLERAQMALPLGLEEGLKTWEPHRLKTETTYAATYVADVSKWTGSGGGVMKCQAPSLCHLLGQSLN